MTSEVQCLFIEFLAISTPLLKSGYVMLSSRFLLASLLFPSLIYRKSLYSGCGSCVEKWYHKYRLQCGLPVHPRSGGFDKQLLVLM